MSNFFTKLFNNKIFLAVLSVVLSTFIWLFVNVERADEINKTVENVPVAFTSEREGYKLFVDCDVFENLADPNGEKISGTVEVRGFRYIVDDSGMPDNIRITNSNTVTNIGETALNLVAQPVGDETDFEIISVEPTYMYAYFDTESSGEFNVEIDDSLLTAESGFYYRTGDAKIESGSARITLSGPSTVINKIERVIATPASTELLNKNTSITTEYEFFDVNGGKIGYSDLKYLKVKDKYLMGKDFSREVNITIPVYKSMNLTTGVEFSNKPSAYSTSEDFANFDISYEPSGVNVAIDADKADSTSVLNLMTVDFSALNLGTNEFTVTTKEIENSKNCIVLDGTESFKVTITISDSLLSQKTVTGDFAVSVPEDTGLNVTNAQFVAKPVVVIGPETDIEALAAEDISFEADLSGIDPDFKGVATVPVILVGNTTYWTYGEYKAEISIS